MTARTTVVTFYKFVDLPDFLECKAPLEEVCIANDIKGTVLLAEEGINATLAGPQAGIEAVLRFLKADPRLLNLTYKTSYVDADCEPFQHMKVYLKQEIVALREPHVKPAERTGTLVSPENWDQLIRDPEVLLIDTRNDFEIKVGSFEGAVSPKTGSFRDFPRYVREKLDPKKHKKVAMFCTGGVRCEKASSFMLAEGFEEVFQLEGGILHYLEKVPEENSLWRGECFVFDDRVTVNHQLARGDYAMCNACRHPLTMKELSSPDYHAGTSCSYCI